MSVESMLIVLVTVLFLLYGIVIGSFLNVLIYRLPLKENIATERSHCMTCGHTLAWYDLVPLFSYIFLLGKCRYCKTHISAQYPLIEAINGFGYVLMLAVYSFDISRIWLIILDCFIFSFLLVIAVITWRGNEIPVSLCIAILVLAIGRFILVPNSRIEAIIGFFAVSGVLLLLYLITRGRGIGGGDIKLMAAAGFYLGWKKVILAFVIGCVVGAVIHLIRKKVSDQGNRLAFGPYLSFGIWIATICGDFIVAWYLG